MIRQQFEVGIYLFIFLVNEVKKDFVCLSIDYSRIYAYVFTQKRTSLSICSCSIFSVHIYSRAEQSDDSGFRQCFQILQEHGFTQSQFHEAVSVQNHKQSEKPGFELKHFCTRRTNLITRQGQELFRIQRYRKISQLTVAAVRKQGAVVRVLKCSL